ncbi:hypothetical protein D3C81_1302130 [compost metagenome]
MKLPASGYDKGVRAVRLFDAQGNVGFKLLEQTLAQFAGGHPFPFASGERAVIDEERHLQRRLVDLQYRQSLRLVRIGNRFANINVLDPSDGYDIASSSFFDFHAAQALESEQLLDASGLLAAVACHNRHGLALANDAAVYPADGDPA